jgi:predicted membrane metal-binding protein
VLPGDDGAIAAMLIDGKRDAIAPNVYDALFVSGIGHVLSISGYHVHNVISGAHRVSLSIDFARKSVATS